MAAREPIALVMAGGSGTRFWPSSTKAHPKQFLKFFGDESLIQATINRLSPLVRSERVYICAGASQSALLKAQLPQITNLILEPMGRNTAPCLMLSMAKLAAAGHSDDTPIIVLPADHHVPDARAFRDLLLKACTFATASSGLITLGVVPSSPHTGYGYIAKGRSAEQGEDFFHIAQFVEKPDAERAKRYVDSKEYLWNAGIFVWTLGAIRRAFETFLPDEWRLVKENLSEDRLAAIYPKLSAAPIDVAVMEKTKDGFVLPIQVAWSDLGSWDALYQVVSCGSTKNVSIGPKITEVQSQGCLVKASSHKQVALVGVNDLIIVEEGDRLLILNRNEDQEVRKVATLLDK